MRGFKKFLKFQSLIGNFYWQRGAVSLSFKPYKYYIITGEPYCLSTWIVLLLTWLQRKKTYVWTHGWYGDESLIKKGIKKLFFGLSNHVLLYGDYAREKMIRQGFNKSKLTVIYNSLDYDLQKNVRANLKSSPVYYEHLAKFFACRADWSETYGYCYPI